MIFILYLFTLLVATSFALPLVPLVNKRSDSPKGVISLEIHSNRRPTSNITKRALTDVYGSYTISFGIGSPSQPQNAILDTGSSDTWVNGASSSNAEYVFNSQKSNTFHNNNTKFQISYGAGDAQGDWATDIFTVSNSEIKNQSFAIADGTSSGEGILGLGFIENESTDNPYLNVPANMYAQGLIQKNVYSIYLDSYDSASGRILFGGIDKSKFNGTLYKIPLTKEGLFYVSLSGISAGSSSYDTQGLEVLVDSGTTFCYFPTSLASQIAANYGGEYDITTGLYYISSKTGQEPDLTVSLSGAEITIPGSEVVIDSSLVIDGTPFRPYVLSIMGTNEAPYILGDTFLRSTYTVFDLTDKYIGIAQAVFSNAPSSIVAVDGEVPFIEDAPLFRSRAKEEEEEALPSSVSSTSSSIVADDVNGNPLAEAASVAANIAAAKVTATDAADAASKSASLFAEASRSYVSSKIAEASASYVASKLAEASASQAAAATQAQAVQTSAPAGTVPVQASQVAVNNAATAPAAAAPAAAAPAANLDIGSIVNGVSQLVGNIVNGVGGIVSSATQAAGAAGGNGAATGATGGTDISGLISGLTNGLSGAAGGLSNLGGLASSLTSGLGSLGSLAGSLGSLVPPV